MNNKKIKLSESICREIDDYSKRFPSEHKQSAVIKALHCLQEEDGYLSSEKMEAVANYLDIEPIDVYEVGSFYSMFTLKPSGKHHVSVCTNISCMLRGGDEILQCVERKLGIKEGESTQDGKFFLKKEEECLAACCGAPMMQIDNVYYENLTNDKTEKIIDSID